MKQQNGVIIRVKGKVQGVGFRPFVWQLAKQFNLVGQVYNDSSGVLIELWRTENIPLFLEKLFIERPALSRIDEINQSSYQWVNKPTEFTIKSSQLGEIDTLIVPDAATCSACLIELNNPSERRFHYPFTNCTHCGPRFTIIEQIPYDRKNTSMKSFKLCGKCQQEYENPNDRRFHAQPIACPVCGPQVWCIDKNGIIIATEQLALTFIINQIDQGKIIAMKNLGGFHLICDAEQESVVNRLRQNKKRPHKPFAIMIPSISVLDDYVDLCANNMKQIKKVLCHVSAPIVLLPAKKNVPIAHNVFPDLLEIGIMLPANPLQHLLAIQHGKPVVMTSGNGNGLPPSLKNEEALEQLNDIADYWLVHNRDIVQRADDSVVRVHHDGVELIRRSRGYAPDTFFLPLGLTNTPTLLALGSDLKNTFCIVQKQKAFISQHFGEIQSQISIQQWQCAINHWLALYKPHLDFITADAHPHYFTHQYAKKISRQLKIPFIPVFHHHAHLAACLAEHNYPIDAPKVIGLVLDGIGYGMDGKLWGGECMLFNYAECEKLGGLPAIALPGGDLAAKQPWRNLLAHCLAFIPEKISILQDPVLNIDPNQINLLIRSIEQKINSPLASSAGRLFDAVAAALGIAPKHLSWEGEAACKLEAVASKYKGPIASSITMPVAPNLTLDLHHFWLEWFNYNDTLEAKAFAFHYALAQGMASLAKISAKKYNTTIIVLSGGVLQNQLLRRLLMEQLSEYSVYVPYQLPANDGGISYGQAIIAAAQLMTIQ